MVGSCIIIRGFTIILAGQEELMYMHIMEVAVTCMHLERKQSVRIVPALSYFLWNVAREKPSL